MNAERTMVMNALKERFSSRDDVRVYPAAGLRVCVDLTIGSKIKNIVWDVAVSGTKNDPYSAEGPESIYCVELAELLDFVERKIEGW